MPSSKKPRKAADSLGSGLAQARKEEKARRKAQRLQRRRAKDAVGAIGYDLMYKDGICQVEEGLFSQTLSFSGISYQSAREENQRAVMSVYNQLFDYFGPDVAVQIQVTNTPILEAEVGTRRFYPEDGGELGRFGAEYNRILNDKMREGVSNITKQHLLTYCVPAESVDAAIPKLARIRAGAEGVLSRMKSDAHRLDGSERLEAIHSLLRPCKPFSFDWSEVSAKSGLCTKDLVAPSYFDFKPDGRADCFKSEDSWCQVLVVSGFGSEINDRCLAEIIDLPIPLSVVMHIQGWEKSAAVEYVKRRLNWMDAEVATDQMDAVRKGYDYQLLPSELRYSKEEAQDMLDDLTHNNQNLFSYTGLVYTYAPTYEELLERVMGIVSTARRGSLTVGTLDLRQREGLNSVLPLGHCHVDVSRLLTTAQVAIQMPFACQEMMHPGGAFCGQNKLSNNIVALNRTTLESAQMIVCGITGSGKSFFNKNQVQSIRILHPEDEIVLIDPPGENIPLVAANGGENVELSPTSSARLNPLALYDVADLPRTVQIAYKIEAVIAMTSSAMADGSRGLTEEEKSVVSRCVELAYERYEGSGADPTLQDLYELLLAQPEREAKQMALRYERYVRGSLSFFNCRGNVGFDTRMTNFDLRNLPENMKAFGIIAVLEAVRNRMFANYERGVRTWLNVDEIQSLFSHPAVIEYFCRYWAEGRKFNMYCTGMTQNAVAMLSTQNAREMVLNSGILAIFRQSPTDRKTWTDLLELSAQESAYIEESVAAGEGLLVVGGARIPIKGAFPQDSWLYDLFTTSATEVAERKRAEASARADGVVRDG